MGHPSNRLAIFRGVVQLDDATGALLWRIDNAGVDGLRVNVQADCSLVEFARIVDAMNRFTGINRARLLRIHLQLFSCLEVGFAAGQVLRDGAAVLNEDIRCFLFYVNFSSFSGSARNIGWCRFS